MNGCGSKIWHRGRIWFGPTWNPRPWRLALETQAPFRAAQRSHCRQHRGGPAVNMLRGPTNDVGDEFGPFE